MAFIGRAMPRLEDVRFLRGAGRFTDDYVLPHQAYAAFVRSPHAHARVLRIGTHAARAVPGVLAILTGEDYLADGCVGISHVPVPADALRHDRPAFDSALDEPHLPLAFPHVRYPGEAVAVVIAETPATATDAATLVDVDYEILPAVADVRDALEPGAPPVFDGASDNVAVDASFGDREATDAAFAHAKVVVEHEFRSQRIVNAQLEPRSVLGAYDSETQTYLMIAGSQGALRQRATLAAALRVTADRVHVVCPDVGGGFGPRTSLYPEQVVVTWAARRIGRPVRWTSSRSEGFLTDFQGRDALARARLALDETGQMLALDVDLLVNVGGQTVSYVPLSNAARVMCGVYAIPSAFVRTRGVLTHTTPTGPYRGAGRPEAMFILERLIDLAAAHLGIDRIELRHRNLITRDRLPYRSPLGLTFDSGDFAGAMQRALQLSDWNGFLGRRQLAELQGRLAGIGLANYVESPVGAPHERVTVRDLPDGSVEVVVGTQSSGQGHETTFAQIVADELQVAPARVRLVTGDTARVPGGGGTHSDRSLRLVSTLLLEACAGLRSARAEGRAPVAEASFTGRMPAYPTGTAVCELEIDPDTGALEITRYTCVDDVGQPINPLIVRGQVHGGIVQGLGQALGEGVVFEPGSAQALTGSFLDYSMPRAAGLPWFTSELVEDPTAGNPLRVKGGGESGITPCMAAVVNAAVDALAPFGVRHLDMPLSPGRIWRAIHAAN